MMNETEIGEAPWDVSFDSETGQDVIQVDVAVEYQPPIYLTKQDLEDMLARL